MPVTIVTGGTFGLGQTIAIDLAQRGHKVVALGLRDAQVSSMAKGFDAVLAEVERKGLSSSVDVLDADVSDEAAVRSIVDHTMSKYGRIDGLVNNAAIGPLGTVLTTDATMFDRILAVNVRGTYLCCRNVIPHMAKNGGGSIVNIGSGAGYGKPNMAAYASSKGAIQALTMAMAYDHFESHIRVNLAIPGGGGIVSGMSIGRYDGDEALFKSRNISGTVAGRAVDGHDLANAVAFLLSDEAATISGTVIDVGCFFHQGGPLGRK